MIDHAKILEIGLDSAIARYNERVEKPFPITPKLEVIDDQGFWALAEPFEDRFVIRASHGIVDQLVGLINHVKQASDRQPVELQLNIPDVESALAVSMQWLMLHEMHHFQLRHFALNGGACLVENSSAWTFSLTSRETLQPSLIKSLPSEIQPKASLAMELQADQDSTEIVIGAYHQDYWDQIRFHAACISVVMVLIEREERKFSGNIGETHPRADTRIFMMLTYLTELWSVPARKRSLMEGLDHIPTDYLPDREEIEGYLNEVVGPIISDSRIIASLAQSEGVTLEIDDAEAILDDLDIVTDQYELTSSMLQTAGAKEWLSLLEASDHIYRILRDKVGVDIYFAQPD